MLRGFQTSDNSAQGVGWLITDLADDSDFGLSTAKTTFTGKRGKSAAEGYVATEAAAGLRRPSESGAPASRHDEAPADAERTSAGTA